MTRKKDAVSTTPATPSAPSKRTPTMRSIPSYLRALVKDPATLRAALLLVDYETARALHTIFGAHLEDARAAEVKAIVKNIQMLGLSPEGFMDSAQQIADSM